MQFPSHVKRVLLTGGAGFIGSHVLDLLVPTGVEFTVYDNLSNGKLAYLEPHLSRPNVTFIEANVLDLARLTEATRGQDLVWHLAANTDIIGSHEQPSRDLNDCAIGTFNVVEAMRKTGVRDLIFASTGAVYGNICAERSVSEDAGPLLPVSTYGAGKIASEAFISSFCHVYDLRAWMYRFGNVIGARMDTGGYDPEPRTAIRLHRTADPGASAWQTEAWYKLISDVFWIEHSLPLWNPYNAYGTPLSASALSQPFFPLTMLLSIHAVLDLEGGTSRPHKRHQHTDNVVGENQGKNCSLKPLTIWRISMNPGGS